MRRRVRGALLREEAARGVAARYAALHEEEAAKRVADRSFRDEAAAAAAAEVALRAQYEALRGELDRERAANSGCARAQCGGAATPMVHTVHATHKSHTHPCEHELRRGGAGATRRSRRSAPRSTSSAAAG
jgi:hypothetical protein